ncbi:NAD(P)H-dependent oxidoreductase [Roseateles sp. DAIF2]|uniref:flavodoxin family protein n=1 Tax=Roseateles sp. DAIF2 TaxID=2714952 RepID=UPI0018A24F33|nr:NAD(P)H-dependent oxidoreductase [Roseateles sp. DAIF2]QPF71713.1 NAD(P)H-dependent oxidoreductase [Roseateles sp. DAIF2]
MSTNFLFLVASTRVSGVLGNTEALARRAAEGLPPAAEQRWEHLARLSLPPFTDLRHDVGSYPMPEGDAKRLLDATLAASDLVLVAPVYWYSLPATVKLYLDHWSAWMRVPGLDFKARMAGKRFWLVTTSGDRAKAQPTIDSARLSAEFMAMDWREPLWGKGGPPDTVQQDASAWAQAPGHFRTIP